MFKSLLGFGKGKDFLTEVLDEFTGMINDTQTIFVSSYGNLFNPIREPGLGDKIYEIDRRVNSTQKNIRKRIVEHLSLQPTVDTIACLLLMSLIKDAERVGDLAKNIYEVRGFLGKQLDKAAYTRFFGDIDTRILELFNMTRDAIVNSDEEKAGGTWEIMKDIKNRCEDILTTVSESDLPVKEAVLYALMTRYYKRIASHLTNIATSVIVPLDKLDYFEADSNTEE